MMQEPLSEEEYRMLREYGALNEDADRQMQQQMAMAKMLRQGNAPQMRQAGGIAKAPHWLELIGGLAREKAAGMQDKQAGITSSQMARRKQQQNEMVMRGLLGRGGGPVNTYNPDNDSVVY